MRLLPVGADHGRHRLAQAEPSTIRDRHRHRNERKYLPLGHLSANTRGDQAGRRDEWWSVRATEQGKVDVINMSRRSLLGAIPATSLVLAVRFPQLVVSADQPKYGALTMP